MATSWSKYEVFENLVTEDSNPLITEDSNSLVVVMRDNFTKVADTSTSWTKVADV